MPWNQNGEWARGILYGLCRALRAEKFDQDIVEVYELAIDIDAKYKVRPVRFYGDISSTLMSMANPKS